MTVPLHLRLSQPWARTLELRPMQKGLRAGVNVIVLKPTLAIPSPSFYMTSSAEDDGTSRTPHDSQLCKGVPAPSSL